MDATRLIGMAIAAATPLGTALAETMLRPQTTQGAVFARAYLPAQVTGHQELQRLHTVIATSCGPAPEWAIPTVALSGINTHIAMIGMLQDHHRG